MNAAMIMTYNPDLKRFEVTTTYQEYMDGHVDKVKAARFRFEKNPKAVWFTEDPERASLLISCADEVAKDMLKIRASQRDEALAMSRASDAEVPGIEDLTLTPYPFQRAGIAYSEKRKAVFFCDEPGLGKTLQALASVHIHKAYPCIAVVPATLKINWRKEAQRCIPELKKDGKIHIINGEKPYDLPNAWLYIINYDILPKWVKTLQKMAVPLESIILDESHFAKNINTQRTKACLELARGIRYIKEKGRKAKRVQITSDIPYRYLLSGTPEPNRPSELESQLDILGVLHQFFGGPWGFRNRFCGLTSELIWTKDPKTKRAKQMKVFRYDGATNTDELQRLLREHVMVRRLKLEVLKDLPPKRHQCIEVACNGSQWIVDKERDLEEEFERRVARLKILVTEASNSGDKKTFEEATAELQKAYEAHFADMARLAHEAGLAKVPKVVQFVLELLEGNEKVAVFAHHHDVEHAIEKAFKDAGIETTRLTGMESSKEKDKAITAFQEGTARVFIGGLKCGIGYTITAASRVVLAELDWTPGVMDQAIDRLHRIGQLDSVLATYIVLENSLDAKKVGMLLKKRDTANKVLDKDIPRFDVPAGMPEPKPEKPQFPPAHVFAILDRLGIKEEEIPF